MHAPVRDHKGSPDRGWRESRLDQEQSIAAWFRAIPLDSSTEKGNLDDHSNLEKPAHFANRRDGDDAA